jgi:hypothetical protein
MPEPTSHAAAATIVLSGVGASTVTTFLGIDTGALFWAFLGAVCWQAANPKIESRQDIVVATAFVVISTVIGTLAPSWVIPLVRMHWEDLQAVPMHALVALPAFILGLVRHLCILKVAELIRTYKREGA